MCWRCDATGLEQVAAKHEPQAVAPTWVEARLALLECRDVVRA